MIIRRNLQALLILLGGIFVTYGCNDNSTETKDNAEQKSALSNSTSSNSVESKAELTQSKTESAAIAEVPTIELESLPDSINLDPCQLLSDAELASIGLPTDQHLSQQGFSQQLPNHRPITPFVSCKWRSVDQGTPVGWVKVQQIKGEFTPEVEESFGLGDVSWKATLQGRDHLMIKAGERLVMISTQIPYNDKSTMEANVWIGQKVLGRLQTIAESTNVKAANSQLVGGPSVDICAVAKSTKPYELLQGDVAWSFPNILINSVPSQNERPQEDGVSCVFSSNRRGAVYVHYLGADGVKRWTQHYEKNGEKISLNSREAFKDRKMLFIPLTKGGILIDVQGIRYFTDEQIDKKIEETALALLKELG
ncbi:MAG: hypothetical protein HWE27_13910 [Gammaproteobacteria bacterium]|nr:hypothetical protein [Gammaproteobacteria bacterium]